jgi:hypothetical protein
VRTLLDLRVRLSGALRDPLAVERMKQSGHTEPRGYSFRIRVDDRRQLVYAPRDRWDHERRHLVGASAWRIVPAHDELKPYVRFAVRDADEPEVSRHAAAPHAQGAAKRSRHRRLF